MPITFDLKQISISGFRGIKTLELELPKLAPLVLIGGNNCGKSTVLDSIAYALEGPKFYAYEVEEFDFFRSSAGEPGGDFSIEIAFAADRPEHLPAVRGIESPQPIHGCRVTGKRRRKDRLLESRAELFKSDGKAATYAPRTPLKGDAAQKWSDHNIGYTKRTARWRDIPESKPEVWHLSPDNLYASLYTWKTGPLHRLSKWLAESFFQTSWSFEHGGKDRKMPDAMIAAHGFFSDAVSNFPPWKDFLRPKFQEVLGSYIGRQAGIELRPTVQQLQDWLTQQLMLSFSTDCGGAATPLPSMGHGWQSLVRMAALEVLSGIPDQARERVVLLVEEPETYLHPHLTRRFRRVLNELAAQGWTVVLSTHSPYMFRLDGQERVVRLRRTGDVVSAAVARGNDATDAFRMQSKLDERGSHEFMFAQKAVFCEGKADVFALRIYLGKLGLDLDTLGVTIVDAGSAQNIPDYASLSGALLVPWIAITDEDLMPTGVNKKTEKVRSKLAELSTERDFQTQWPTSLEVCLKNDHIDAAWLASSLEQLTVETIRAEYPQFAKACDEVARFLAAAD